MEKERKLEKDDIHTALEEAEGHASTIFGGFSCPVPRNFAAFALSHGHVHARTQTHSHTYIKRTSVKTANETLFKINR